MNLIRTIHLLRTQKSGVIHCHIELQEMPGSPDRFLVNYRQGREGGAFRERTRTPEPATLADADILFALLAAERQAQGFDTASVGPATATVLPPAAVPPAPDQERLHIDASILARLDIGNWSRLTQKQRNRTIWRIGERRLRAAVPALVDQLQRGDDMQDYCIAWAIARCGDAGAAVAMRELHTRGATEPVRRMALQAWLLLADPAAIQIHVATLIANWPTWLHGTIDSPDAQQWSIVIEDAQRWTALSLSDWLEQLDQCALSNPAARNLLLTLLRQVPMRAGIFKAIRHLYKAAEMRADAELFGLLHQRFETSAQAATSSTGRYVRRRYLPFAEEAARPDSTVAYSVRTRGYLLRRSWRTLRRLGRDNDPAYIDLALGMLLAMDDRDAGQPTQRAGRYYDQYGHWLLFNRMLRANGLWTVSRSGLSWYQPAPIVARGTRDEAFPALWDARPDALLWLLHHSRCEGVHTFAARALADNHAYCAQLSLDQLRQLLRSHYLPTARLAFELSRARFAPGVPDMDWLLVLLHSGLPEAMQYAIDRMGDDPVRYCADALLVASVASLPEEAVRRRARLLCQCALALPGQGAAIVLHLLDWLDNCSDLDNAPAIVPSIVDDILWLLENPLRDAAANAPYARVLELLEHRLSSVRLLGCAWLLLHAVPVSAIPAPLMSALLQASDPAERSMGARLFSALPDNMLSTQAQLIYVLCTNSEAGVRSAIDSVIQRLGLQEAALRATLVPLLLDALFRSETGAGMHHDVAAWLAGPLGAAEELADPDLLRRLLAARSHGAHRLATFLLPRYAYGDFSVMDWATFGRNPNASVRQWAYAAYTAHPALIRAQLQQALRLLDSRFDDSIAFASTFFATHCSAENWSPLLLVALCDHPSSAVQQFGRDMISTHCDIADAADSMLKLSQHPSADMQLFVSTWLESASTGDLDQLRRLEPYFVTVLSQVNRARVAKARVQAFLRSQALLSEPIAAFVARLFARQVLTVALADKAQYIEGLRAIGTQFPGLAPLLTIHPPVTHPTARVTP